jgi:hypothetical protein
MTVPTTTAPTGPRRRMGAGLTTLLVVDVLLALAVGVALWIYFSGGDDGDGAGGTPSVTASPGGNPSPDDGADAELTTFALPSGNIACDLTADRARCTIAEIEAEPEGAEGCEGTIGQVVQVDPQGASAPCVSGALPGPAAPGTPVLEYGDSTTVGDYTCESATSGVTCTHEPSGAGFRLARAGFELF